MPIQAIGFGSIGAGNIARLQIKAQRGAGSLLSKFTPAANSPNRR